ncbi:DUF2798 domain-containing protein [Colwellia sp. Arc7-635]|jgi:hypothetical protein|uniref:DUF2798 domain-containing protein n=1 Tax=Colwellia sp. Arc7-635 TaxID=2497879 RepID=UPI000F85387C|nr:DUF2798 domain-containing protein [Colwellia sp. Arc7-635]AZQ84025.1 DUF2798 domain-containing protein [Colwellia sp. Arc7-635]
MIARKYQKILFFFLMALFMSGIMSFAISLFNLGLVNDLVIIWLKAWAFAFCVAFPVITIIAPVAQKLVLVLLKAEE